MRVRTGGRDGIVTHGMRRTSVYDRWQAMVQRCTNPKNKRFKDYGGRGITMLTWAIHLKG